jgi:hypothetical protein
MLLQFRMNTHSAIKASPALTESRMGRRAGVKNIFPVRTLLNTHTTHLGDELFFLDIAREKARESECKFEFFLIRLIVMKKIDNANQFEHFISEVAYATIRKVPFDSDVKDQACERVYCGEID